MFTGEGDEDRDAVKIATDCNDLDNATDADVEEENATVFDVVEHNADEDDDEDEDNNNSYDCHYKCKQYKMSAIRCNQQQRYHQRYDQHQSLQQHSNVSRNGQLSESLTSTHHSVINMGGHCSTNFETLCTNEAISPTSSTASSSASLQQQHLTFALQHHQQQHHTQHVTNYTQQSTTCITSLHHQRQQQQQLEHAAAATSPVTTSTAIAAAAAAAAAAANRRDHNIDYSALFVQLSGTLPTLYRCVSCNKIVSNRWHHANIHRPQSHECPVCGQKFTRRDNMKAHCKIKHADIKDRFFSHYVHM